MKNLGDRKPLIVGWEILMPVFERFLKILKADQDSCDIVESSASHTGFQSHLHALSASGMDVSFVESRSRLPNLLLDVFGFKFVKNSIT